MSNSMSRSFFRRSMASVLVGLTGIASVTAARADAPHFSGPSMARPAAPTTFSGKGFAANAAVTVMVLAPSGAAAGFSAVTSADGALSYTLVPSQEGAYTITVTDSGGQALAKLVVAVMR